MVSFPGAVFVSRCISGGRALPGAGARRGFGGRWGFSATLWGRSELQGPTLAAFGPAETPAESDKNKPRFNKARCETKALPTSESLCLLTAGIFFFFEP